MTRCPQKQGFPGVPVGAQTLTRPFRLFSRVCSCPVAPRAGPGSHPPPPRALRDRHPQNTLGSLPASPSLLAPHPTPVYWNLHQHTSTCVAVAFPFVKGRPVLLVPVDPVAYLALHWFRPWVWVWRQGFGARDERGQRSTRQWTASKDNTKNFTLDAIFPPVSSQNVGILLLSFMGRKYKILVLNVVSEMWGQMPAYVSPQCVQSQVGR